MKKIYKFLLLNLFLTPLFLYSQVFVNEDFSTTSGTTPPAGWANYELGGVGVWRFDNPSGIPLTSPITNPAAIIDADNFYYDGEFEEAALETPSFDASSATGYIFLELDHQFFNWWGWGYAEYLIEVWDGTSWNVVANEYMDSPNPEHLSIDITDEVNYASDAKVRFIFYSWDEGYWVIDNVSIRAIDCLPVTNLFFSNHTTSSIDLSWDPVDNETEWEIEYGPKGFTLGTGITVTVDDGNPETQINGLDAGTYYDFYIRALCGGVSYFSTPFLASTLGTCGTYTITLTDDFGDGWGSGYLSVYINGNFITNYTLLDGYGPESYDINVNANDIISIIYHEDSFYEENFYTVTNELGELVAEEGDFNYGPGNIGDPILGTGLVACPSCPAPTNAVIEDFTEDSFTISWEPGGTETSWIIEYGPVGFTPGTGTIESDNDGIPTHTISGLPGSTLFHYYIKADCGGDESIWLGPNTAYTNGSCGVYFVNLYDSYGDGWEDGSLDIYVNGSLEVNYTLPNGDSIQYVLITDLDDIISAVYNESQYPEENNWTITDLNGNIIFNAQGPNNLGDITIPNGVQMCPTCAGATDLTVRNVSTDIATIAWTNPSAQPVNIQWGPEGFAFGTGTEENGILVDSLELTNLDENSYYSFYVQIDCGTSSSMWVGPYTFKTYCPAIPALSFCESFDSGSMTEGCWTILDVNNDGDTWNTNYTSNTNSGDQVAVMFTDGNGGNDDDWLITPHLTLTGVEAMRFYYRVQSSGEPNILEVRLSTTGILPSDFTHVLMAQNTYTNTTYKDTVIDLTAFTGNVFIAFRVPPSTTDGWRMFIDDVCFNTCIPVSGTDGTATVCQSEGTIDLNTVATVGQSNGVWTYTNSALISGSTFNLTNATPGQHVVKYIVNTFCTADTTLATITIDAPSNAGQDGSITACKNEPIDLFDGIVSSYDQGGVWYDPSYVALANSEVIAPSFAGQYNYSYIVGNGVCPDDTSKIVVTIISSCDWLQIQEEIWDQVSIYPNPSAGLFTIESSHPGAFKLSVMDINGREVYIETTITTGKNTIDIGNVVKGTYFLKLSSETNDKVYRIVIQ